MAIPSKYLFVGFLALWSTCGLTSGWNDFERDIGHGFKISKTDSFHVCLYQSGGSTTNLVCGDRDRGDYGPVTGYVFTDEHLLVRTNGAKPSRNSAFKFTADTDREHFFIITKQIPDPYNYSPIGPLDRDEFHDNPAVPADIRWEYPTRFATRPAHERDTTLLGTIIITIIAWLIVFGPIVIWPVILFCVAWWVFRRLRMRSRGNN